RRSNLTTGPTAAEPYRNASRRLPPNSSELSELSAIHVGRRLSASRSSRSSNNLWVNKLDVRDGADGWGTEVEHRGRMTPASAAHEVQSVIDDLHAQYRALNEGEVATYIPELAKADPDKFDVSVVTTEGRLFEAGDCEQPFTLQSVSKPFTFGIAPRPR